MKTPLIKYNVRERGRQHRGARRNFDCATLASIINGPEVQERVANRDLHGYLGHWVRMDHGMEPPEGAIVGGKMVVLEPAFVTTHLRADDQGNIEHISETMDNANGAAVERYMNSKAGGFSSAIRTTVRSGLDIPVSFHGFDYVKEPNFTDNRAYNVMDSVGEDDEGKEFWMLDGIVVADLDRKDIFDAAIREAGASMAALRGLYDSVTRDHQAALETLEHVANENADLLGRIVANKLDSASHFIRPERTPTTAGADATLRRAAAFHSATLPAFDSAEDAVERVPVYKRLRRR
ncbi:hypothetical protein [Nevskia ramosa]|uniref:hypothetical protein n=1 Tax=Nevskia ramosa TaxID=64002 RepID=UPI003D1230D7